MNKALLMGAITLGSALTVDVFASGDALEACIKAVQKTKSGSLLKLEKLVTGGKGAYELELRDADGNEWEFICAADSGKITETESEVSDPNSPAFKKNLKIGEQEAMAIALKAYPGKVEEVEYEVEENGSSSYEFDILDSKGMETKVEVDAASGKIIEVAVEEWEVGEESDEKR
ncbi:MULTISPECIES: PepSY domain-containing protein [Methylomonas]|uniref:PepSY domain-containing protein n=1 Tax=Methylomonas TaxID=416 RepID=UPI0012319FD6|nr:PepSY domain-containing protein [Methylomonas rhizoryzae]